MFLLFVLFAVELGEAVRNNGCKSFDDYREVGTNPNCWYNPAAGATPEQIARRYGYYFESYSLTTRDGYILNLFRINNRTSLNENKTPLLLLAGISVDSSVWLQLYSKSSVFIFANDGHDVWLANNRGTKFSDQHTKYTVFDRQYWNFSFHEMGVYDLDTIIDFVAAKTKRRISIVGHSMGCTMAFVYASLKPEMAERKLKGLVALAPVVFMDNVGVVLKVASRLREQLWGFFSKLEVYGVGRNFPSGIDLIRTVCSQYPFKIFCGIVAKKIGGGSDFNEKLVHNLNFGFSMKTLMHFAQIIATGKFQFFDYGRKFNNFFYKVLSPPQYPLSGIKIPVFLIYGEDDTLATKKDIITLYNRLDAKKTLIKCCRFSHSDFHISKGAPTLYHKILKYLDN